MRDHTNINVSESVSMADSNKSPKTMHADVNRDSSTLTWKEGGTVRRYPHHCRMPDIRIFKKMRKDKLHVLECDTQWVFCVPVTLLDGDEAVAGCCLGWHEITHIGWLHPRCDRDKHRFLRHAELGHNFLSIVLGMLDLLQALAKKCLEVPPQRLCWGISNLGASWPSACCTALME